MKIIEGKEKEYQEWRAKNDDPYSRRCFTYAEEWADMMEKALAEGRTLFGTGKERCLADELSSLADTDGITGFMYGAAVSILSKTWIHGEELRRWHNIKTQIHDEGEKANASGGTLNPALLNISE
jgi:hypothetical protein